MLDNNDYSDRHPAVRWVFSSGGQLRYQLVPNLYNPLFFPLPSKNEVTALRRGRSVWKPYNTCVIVTEEDESAFGVLSIWRHQVALDLATGRTVLATFGEEECTCSTWGKERYQEAGGSLIDFDGEFAFYDKSMSNQDGLRVKELYIGRDRQPLAEFTRLIAFSPGRGYDGLYKAHILRFAREGVVVIGTHDGFVICLDLEKLDASEDE